jgi:hypothetical protein
MPRYERTTSGLSLFIFALLAILLISCNGKITTNTPMIPGSKATLTVEQQLVLDKLKHQHDCDQSCLATRQANDSYAEYSTPQKIKRAEWEMLFPNTKFYIAPWVDHYMGRIQRRNTLFVFQDEQWYEAKTYDLLLEANKVVITDENRELAAKAWALMTIPDYLENEVVFTKWQAVEMPKALHNFNYCLEGWTKLKGLQIKWWFVFSGTQLKIASGPGIQKYQAGEYLDESDLRDPMFLDYTFYER